MIVGVFLLDLLGLSIVIQNLYLLILVIAFIIRGLKEFGEPSRKAMIMDLAPEDYKASTFGTYYLLRDIIVSIAAFSSAALWNADPAVNFFVATGFGLIGTVLFAIFGKEKSKDDGEDDLEPEEDIFSAAEISTKMIDEIPQTNNE